MGSSSGAAKTSAPGASANNMPSNSASTKSKLSEWQDKYLPDVNTPKSKVEYNRKIYSGDGFSKWYDDAIDLANEAGSYYDNSSKFLYDSDDLQKIYSEAAKLSDYTQKTDTRVMSVSGNKATYTGEQKAFLEKNGFSSLGELEKAIENRQGEGQYDKNYGSKYVGKLLQAKEGSKAAIEYLDAHKGDYDNAEEIRAQLESYSQYVDDLASAMGQVKDYFNQWENEDEYKNGYKLGKTIKNIGKATANYVAGKYTASAAQMSASKQGQLSMGQSAMAAAEGETEAQALEEVNKARLERAEEKENKANEFYEKASGFENMAKWQKNGFEKLLISAATQLPEIGMDAAVNFAVGTATGLPGAGLVNMAVRAFGDASHSAREAGLSWEKSEIAGWKSAAIEVGTEKMFSAVGKLAYGPGYVDNMVETAIDNATSNKLVRAALKGVASFGEEGLEEVMSDLINPAFDYIFNLRDEDGNLIDELSGAQILEDFLVGGIMGLAGTGGQVINNARKNSKIKKAYAGAIDELVEEGLESAEGTRSRELAEEFKKILDKGKKLSGAQVSELLEANEAAFIEEDKASINAAVQDRLAELGEESNIGAIAAAVTKSLAGERLTKADRAALAESAYAERVLNEASPDNILSGEYTSDWAQRLQTNRINAEAYNGIDEDSELEDELAEETVEEVPAEESAEFTEDSQFAETWDANNIVESMFPDEVKSGILTAAEVASIQSMYDNSGRTMDLNDVENMVREYIATKEIDNGRDSMDGSLGRDSGESTREQGGEVQSRAAEDKGENGVGEHRADSGRESVRRKAESSTESKVSAKELGITDGTEEKNNSVIPESKWSPAEKRIAEAFGPASNGFTIVSNNLSVAGGKVNGAKTKDGKIIVSRSSRLYKAEQLMIHEGGHLYLDDDAELRDKLRGAAVDALSEREIDELTAAYALKWKGLYGDEKAFDRAANGELDTQELEEFSKKYVTEMLCDALAGIDRADTKGTSRFSQKVREVFLFETGIDIDALLNGRESKAQTDTEETEGKHKPAKPRNNGPPPSESYSYAGERAETADRLSLDNAKQMLADDIDPEIIREQTGWFKGMDGKWRFEIDDSEMSVDSTDKDYLIDTGGTLLKYLIKHDALFSAYPELEEMFVNATNTEGKGDAYYSATSNEIFINAESLKNLSDLRFKKLLIHEIQHAVQTIEGFTGGASPNNFYDYFRTAGEIEAYDTSDRLTYSPKERKNTRPDIDRADVVFSDGGISYFSAENNRAEKESKRLLRLVRKNIDIIPSTITFVLQGDGIVEGIKSKYISDIFDSQGNVAHRDDLGDIELTKTGAEDTIFHGFGANKFIAAQGIKSVLENGTIISKTENYENSGNTRYVIAASGLINNADAIMAVAIKEYVYENGRKAFYLHEVLVKNKDTSPIMAAQQNAETAGKVSSENSIYTEEEKVNSYSVEEDSEGNELSEQQKEFFKDSKIRDEDGRLMVVYHGTDSKFNVFDRTKSRANMDIQGNFFSPWEDDARGYGSNVRAYYLNITNPASEGEAYRALRMFQGQNGAGVKAREYLESLGYDGVNNGNEEYIAFNPEQIKLIDNAEPTSSEDVRYSVEDETLTAEEVQRRKEFQSTVNKESLTKLRERQSRLEGRMQGYMRTDNLTEQMKTELEQMKADHDAVAKAIEKKQQKAEQARQDRQQAKADAASTVDSLSVRQTTAKSRKAAKQQLYENFGIESGRAEIGSTIDAFLDRWIEQGSIRNSEVTALENTLMEQGAFRIESADDYAQEISARMRNGQISVPASVVEEFGDDWNAFRRRAFANRIYLSIDSNHAGIDQWTMDLAASFGEGTFDGNADLKTQVERIVDLAEEGRAENLSVYQISQRMAKMQGRDYADAYLDEMHEKLMQTLKSFAQSAKIEMETVKNNVYRKAREDAERKAKAERAAAERAQREFQKKTLKQLQWLKRNQNFMGSDFQEEDRKILADIDTIAVSAAREMNWSDKYNATWEDIAKMYTWAKDNDPNFLPSADLDAIVARVNGIHLDELSATDLENIYKAAVALRTAYYNRNNIIGDELHGTFAEAYDSAIDDMREAVKPKNMTGRGRKIMDSQLNPINRIERMFGWKEESAGFQIFGRGLERGERQTKRYVEQANQILDEWMEENKEWVATADGQGKDAVWYDIEVPELVKMKMGDKPIFGKTVTVSMTPMQKIYLYLESKNYDNLRHMVGGRTFADKELYSEGKKAEAFAHGTTISLAPETVKKLVADLTPTEMELATILEKQYFNGYARTEINRVSNILYGYDRAMSDNYAPIFTNHNYNKTEPGVMQDGTAEGVGHMKTRVQGAKNPTYNVSAMEAFQKHVSQTSRFVGMAIPSQNAKTLLNWSGRGTTMQEEITHNWSQKELDSLTNVIAELNAPTYMEQSEFAGAIGTLMSNYIGGVFGANITVAAKVLASKPTAAIVLGNQYYPTPAQQRAASTELISKYTSELDVRIRGYGTPELAAMTLSTSKYMQWVQSHKATKLLLGGGLLQAADIYVTKTMWPWAENKVRAEYPDLEVGTQEQIDNGTSPFYKKVAEVYEQAIGETQSMYDIMHRSDIMRDTNEITRSFTIFHTDSLQAMNLIRKRAGELDAAKSNLDKAEGEAEKEAAQVKVNTAAKAVGVCIGNVILMNVLVTMFDILRDLFRHRDDKYENDEGEITVGSFMSSSLTQLVENASGLLIGADTIIPASTSLFTGDNYYSHELIAVQTLNDIIELGTDTAKGLGKFVGGLFDIIKEDGDAWQYISEDADFRGVVKNAAEKITHYFSGIPVENVEKLITNTIGWIFPQVTAAYDGIWSNGHKKDLAESGNVEADVKSLYGTRAELSDETASELARLYEAGYKNAIISDTPDSLTVDSVEHELSAAQQQRYDQTIKANMNMLDEVIQSKEYQEADDETKAKMLNRLYDYAKDKAKMEVIDGYDGETFTNSVSDWRAQGMSWGRIMSGNTTDINKFAKYIDAGMSEDYAGEVYDAISILEPEFGANSVSAEQKVMTIAYLPIPENEKEAAMKVAYGNSDKAYNIYMIARKHDVGSADYADFLKTLASIDLNGGYPKQTEFIEAINRSNIDSDAARDLWYNGYGWKHTSPWG